MKKDWRPTKRFLVWSEEVTLYDTKRAMGTEGRFSVYN